MPTFKDEAARFDYYVKKYGPEEGAARYEKVSQSRPPTEEAAPDRQPSLLDRVAGEQAPRRRAKKPAKSEVVETLATGIVLAETGVIFLHPPWAEDRLRHEEIGRLADALADEILHSDKLTQWVMKAQKANVHIKLLSVVASIAIPRMAKHGMLPGSLFGLPDAEPRGDSYPVAGDGVVLTPEDVYAANPYA